MLNPGVNHFCVPGLRGVRRGSGPEDMNGGIIMGSRVGGMRGARTWGANRDRGGGIGDGGRGGCGDLIMGRGSRGFWCRGRGILIILIFRWGEGRLMCVCRMH